jgi:ATP-dependent Clp protease ATP-binding subunit ClpB
MPEEIDELTRRRIQLEIEREALRKETDPAPGSVSRCSSWSSPTSTEEIDVLSARWNLEKEAIAGIREAKQEIEETRAQAERAERRRPGQRPPNCATGRMNELESRAGASQDELEKLHAEGSDAVRGGHRQDVAEVVARWTGVPCDQADGG